MKIGHFELFVSNPSKARDFYTRILGFELVTEQPGGTVWVKNGEIEFLLRPGEPPSQGATYQNAASAFVFYTENLDEEAARLQERGLEFKGTDGSDKCLTFTDLDGNWFQLVNPNEK